jgi:RNA polymerase sigma-70 factor (ECF subfamily)
LELPGTLKAILGYMQSCGEGDDVELLERVRAGDRDAFVLLYARHRAPLYRVARLMLDDPSAAEDVLHDVFMVVMQGAPRFDARVGAVSTYLYGIARNLCRRDMRTRLRTRSLEEAPTVPSVQPPLPHDADAAAFRVREALKGLPRRYREVVILCDIHERSYAETAAVVSCAVGTVRSRLHRGRAMLASRIRAMDARTSASTRVLQAVIVV